MLKIHCHTQAVRFLPKNKTNKQGTAQKLNHDKEKERYQFLKSHMQINAQDCLNKVNLLYHINNSPAGSEKEVKRSQNESHMTKIMSVKCVRKIYHLQQTLSVNFKQIY